MAEILTESFCERCGSRYTFESEVPRARLRGVRVLSRGFRNFVLDDKTSIDEAMAAARDDTDRALTAHQLEAFHKTFNFCMQCRQYICPNCWNQADGQCLTCAPMLGHGIPPAPFPDLDPSLGIAPPGENGLAAAAMDGHKHVSDGPNGLDAVGRQDGLTLATAPTSAPPEMIGGEVESLAEAAVAAVAAESAAAASTQTDDDAFAAAEAAVEAELVPAVEVSLAEPDVIEAQVLAAEPEPDVIPEAVAPLAASVAPLEDVAAAPEGDAVGEIEAVSGEVDASTDRAGAVATPTSLLLAGLRPGESLDDAIAAFESAAAVPSDLESNETEAVEADSAVDSPETLAAVATPTELETLEVPATPEAAFLADALDVPPAAPEDVSFGAVAESADALWASPEEPPVNLPVVAAAAEPEPVSRVEPLDEIPTGAVGVEATVAIEPVVVEPVAVEPVAVEPVAVEALVEAAPEPVVEAAPEPPAPPIPESSEIAAAAASVDVVAQPTWSIVAPDPRAVADVPGPAADPFVEIAAQGVPTPSQEPDWPAQPQWPSPQPFSGLPFLGRPAVPTGGVDALWAESDLAVTAPPTGTDRPAGGVQPCVSCGLSLSASARFCRRCGTSQVG